MTIAEIKKTAEQKMGRSIESLKNDLQKIRTGRAHAGILDQVHVDYYGSPVPISQVANVTLLDARTISVQPWEKGMGAKIEKAIRESDLGLNPVLGNVTVGPHTGVQLGAVRRVGEGGAPDVGRIDVAAQGVLVEGLAAVGDVHLDRDVLGRYRPALEHLAGALGIADRVNWMGHVSEPAPLSCALDSVSELRSEISEPRRHSYFLWNAS